MVSVPPGECVRFSAKLFHSVSDRISLSRPVRSMMVALLAAKFSTLVIELRLEFQGIRDGVLLVRDCHVFLR
jgi:hypothetical protein